jgi:hypothetical protein
LGFIRREEGHQGKENRELCMIEDQLDQCTSCKKFTPHPQGLRHGF